MCKKAPGKSSRQGITLVQLMEMFPDEATAHAWFVKRRWGTTGRFCPRCNSSETQGTPGIMPYPAFLILGIDFPFKPRFQSSLQHFGAFSVMWGVFAPFFGKLGR